MNQLASRGQLRMSLLRWVLVTVPAILAIGMFVGRISGSGAETAWYAALAKPALMPPSWMFSVVWTILYALLGIAIAVVLNARGARLRGIAILVFLVQLLLNYAWPIVFFGRHMATNGLYVIIALLVLAAVTTFLFFRIRNTAGLLLLPYLAWLAFATYLNAEIVARNLDGDTLAVPAVRTQI